MSDADPHPSDDLERVGTGECPRRDRGRGVDDDPVCALDGRFDLLVEDLDLCADARQDLALLGRVDRLVVAENDRVRHIVVGTATIKADPPDT